MELCPIRGTNDTSGSCHGLSQERYFGWENSDRVHDTQPGQPHRKCCHAC